MTVPPDQRVAQLVGMGPGKFGVREYEAANLAMWAGSNSMTRFGVFYRRLGGTAIVDNPFFMFTGGGTPSGWRILNNGNELRAVAVDGSGVIRNAGFTVTASSPGVRQVLVMAFAFDDTELRARLSSGGGAVITATAGGYTAPTRTLLIGGSAAYPSCALLGSDTVALSDADLLTTINEIIDNAEQGRSLDAGLSVFAPEDYVDLADAWQGPGAPLKATLTARVGASSFTKTGEPEAAAVSARF